MLKQVTGILMGINPAFSWAKLFLYYFGSTYIQSLFSLNSLGTYNFHSFHRFIEDLCAINDRNKVSVSFKDIYPEELELKVEHWGTRSTFLDLNITIKEGMFMYKAFDKRESFSFFNLRMPHLSSNIPSSILYGSIFLEIFRIGRCTLHFRDVLLRMSDLINRMKNQGATSRQIAKQIKMAFRRYPDSFIKFGKSKNEFISDFPF